MRLNDKKRYTQMKKPTIVEESVTAYVGKTYVDPETTQIMINEIAAQSRKASGEDELKEASQREDKEN